MGKVVIETKKLKEMLKSVKHAVSKLPYRPAFTGILIESNAQELTMVACDGYKLFMSNKEIVEGTKFKAIVPMFDIPKDAEENTSIEVRRGLVKFDFGNVEHRYKIIEGDFVDYKSLLERKNKFSIRFNPAFLREALTNAKGIVELYFTEDREGVIIEDISNRKNKKLVLPMSKPW